MKKYFPKTLIVTLVLLSFLLSCTPKSPEDPVTEPSATDSSPAITATSAPTPEPKPTLWWRDRVFYEIFVRSFKDSDGDGIGDFQGIIEQLDYLNDGDPETQNDLGITGIWLMPINPSPSYHG